MTKYKTPRTEGIFVRISKRLKEWIKKNKKSPTKLFYDSCKKEGYKGDE
jgi:hypothetical protein